VNPEGLVEQDDERDIKQESDCETVEANGIQCRARRESITSGQSGGCPSIRGVYIHLRHGLCILKGRHIGMVSYLIVQ
jgi:hypothetical protein